MTNYIYFYGFLHMIFGCFYYIDILFNLYLPSRFSMKNMTNTFVLVSVRWYNRIAIDCISLS